MSKTEIQGEKIDFFDKKHQTRIRARKFGLSDPSPNQKCHASTESKESVSWIATVINEKK